ncbi:hypothetical protein Q0M94_00280 [Deinococcus radiomollis]|uniref:SHOCT-like domain-containing protein n=1 Tax=Deinococcus radiomollis TaxID=468916 RepID=UPI003891233A
MREQIRRILGLVKDGRLSVEDASSLLAALSPRLNLKAKSMEMYFDLLLNESIGQDELLDVLARIAEPAAQRASAQSQWQSGSGQQSQSQSGSQSGPPLPPRPSATFKIGGQGFPLDGFDGLGDAISSRVEEALGGLLGKAARPARPGTILKIETEDAHGANFSANLPLSLATHAERLIPPHAVATLERSGLSIEALKLLLQAGPPPGKLLSAEDEHGNSVELSIQ